MEEVKKILGSKKPHELSILEEGLRIRRFEEGLLDLFSKGLIRGTVHTCIGQELTPVTINRLLTDKDFVFGTHRSHGYFLSQTEDYLALAKEILGREGGVTGGIGGTQHLLSSRLITNGIQGGLVPVAVGYASALTHGQIAVSVIGDGSLGQGAVYESLNLASVLSVPMLLLIEDNGIAQSTRSSQVFAGHLKTRIQGFGVKYFECSDESVTNLNSALKEAVEFVRLSHVPAAIRILTRRLGSHSKGDDNRPQIEVSNLRKLDPIENWVTSSPEAARADEETSVFLGDVFEAAVTSEAASQVPRDYMRNLRLERPTNSLTTETLIRNQISQSLDTAMEKYAALEMFGEDIEVLPPGMEKPYNGAFGITGRISSGRLNRLNNTPISEQALVGFGIGRAMAKSETIVEIMFGDFTTLAIDQVRQQASKIASIYGKPIHLPLLIRTPMGGRRGYGPTHSQSFEGLFLGTPNTILYSISPFGVDKSLFSDLLATGLPTVVFENKELYTSEQIDSLPAPYGLIRPTDLLAPLVVQQNAQRTAFTAVSYGSAAKYALDALAELAREHEIFGRLFVFELLQPMNVQSLGESINETENLLLIEESQTQEGLASSLLHSLQESSGYPRFKFGSVGGTGDIGSSRAAEAYALIDSEKIVGKILELVEA